MIKCALDELDKYHVKNLKDDVATANRDYLKVIEDDNRKRLIQKEQEDKARKKQDDVLGRLKFD